MTVQKTCKIKLESVYSYITFNIKMVEAFKIWTTIKK